MRLSSIRISVAGVLCALVGSFPSPACPAPPVGPSGQVAQVDRAAASAGKDSASAQPALVSFLPDTDPAAGKRSKLWQADRLDRGYVLILPGSWGEEAVDNGIVSGLTEAGIDAALEVYAWPLGDFPSGALWVPYNLRATSRNREQARAVVAKILRYQREYPGRPVHLIGYSGGGGIAVWALEELPAGTKVASAILLAPTLSFNYKLGPALNHTDRGIQNFYSPYDVPILMTACSIIGTTDGRHRFPGGAVGFHPSWWASLAERKSHAAQVHQHPYSFTTMLMQGHPGGHYGWLRQSFVATHVAPLINPALESQPPVEASPAAEAERESFWSALWPRSSAR